MKIGYDEIKNRIKENFIKGLYFVMEYKNDTEKQRVLSFALGKKGYIEEGLDTLYEITSNGYKIYEYESKSILTNQIKDHFLVSKDEFPILKLEHYQPKDSSVNYSEDSYIIYQENSNRISSKVIITSLKKDDFEDVSIIVLDSDEVISDEYYRKKYHFIIQNDEILSLRIGNEMFLNGEEGFSLRCDGALKCIGNVFKKITQKIEKVSDNDVKEYSIKRYK